MNKSTQMVLAGIVIILGVVLMVGGIVTGKHGATVGGIIISGVAAQSLISLRKKIDKGDSK
jgi:hypothetical protein